MQELLNQFKIHIWNYVEYHSGALLLACETDQERLEKLQRSFLHDIHVTEETAFVLHAFAPLCLRRAIGALGFLHKRVLGHCHPEVKKPFPMALPCYFYWQDTTIDASSMRRVIAYRPMYLRSIWRYVHIYNRLPRFLVSLSSVHEFQSRLTHYAKQRCLNGDIAWRSSWQSCADVLNYFA